VEGKSIDDILIRNNSLILVDNILYPKYLFEYDITTPDAPKHLATEELPNNGTYEHIIKGDINDDYMVLFSSSVGRDGAFQHLSLFGKQNIQLTYQVEAGIKQSDKETETHIVDIALIDDCLYILRKDRLEYLNLTDEIKGENPIEMPGGKLLFIAKGKQTKKNTPLALTIGIQGEKLIKAPDNRLVAINKTGYELLTLPTTGVCR
jgi:hypothetical protein